MQKRLAPRGYDGLPESTLSDRILGDSVESPSSVAIKVLSELNRPRITRIKRIQTDVDQVNPAESQRQIARPQVMYKYHSIVLTLKTE